MAAIDPKTANVLYHDAAARSYDEKWSISFDERCIAYVRDRAERMLPKPRYERVLEVGCGTGFFILNLWQAGYVGEAHVTDISTGMLKVCAENARRLGCDLRPRVADAEGLPYEDGTFDLVVGHAFLHHLPDPEAGLAEMYRVLAPGGAAFIAGEPTRAGDRIANSARTFVRSALQGADRVTFGALRNGQQREPATDDQRVLRDLEFAVDLHTFEPDDVTGWARQAGFVRVRTETEELLASVFGWGARTLEAEVRPALFPGGWAAFTYRNYLRLYGIDRLLYRFVPKRLFYNLLFYGETQTA